VKRLFGCCFLTAALFFPAAVFAHGVEITDVTGQAGARTFRFMYSTGESMLFAVVKVYPPSAPDATVQESMTDRDGYFSFVPFEDGLWRLTVEDGMGHKGEITVTAAGEAAADRAKNAAPAGKLPTPAAAALGLSLIFNVFTFWYLMGRKLKKQEAVHAHQ
jgi:nickel transport protein